MHSWFVNWAKRKKELLARTLCVCAIISSCIAFEYNIKCANRLLLGTWNDIIWNMFVYHRVYEIKMTYLSNQITIGLPLKTGFEFNWFPFHFKMLHTIWFTKWVFFYFSVEIFIVYLFTFFIWIRTFRL